MYEQCMSPAFLQTLPSAGLKLIIEVWNGEYIKMYIFEFIFSNSVNSNHENVPYCCALHHENFVIYCALYGCFKELLVIYTRLKFCMYFSSTMCCNFT